MIAARANPTPPPDTTPGVTLTEIPLEQLQEGDLEGLLIVSDDRTQYESGTLRLVIPALSLDTLVGDGTSLSVLNQEPGLYDYSYMPGEGDRNVSIAGHRDAYHCDFYYIDRLGEGDYLYLVFGDTVYRYLYKDTAVVAPDDWSVISAQGFSCLTLTSCTPIGVSDHRIIIRAELDGVFPNADDFAFASDVTDKTVN